MASIAYVTDQNMIEFHRLNGNHSINFWKPSTSKKIGSLNSGDLLFFLAKGTEKGKQKEKGLLGYGKFQKSHKLPFSTMWSKYGEKNGYPTKESLSEAIIKVTKHHTMPDSLNCLILEEVVFFQYPVYLSEIGMEISNRIESYIYIDKEDMLNTSKILSLANDVGVDIWSSLFHEEETATFMKDAQIQTIANIYEKIKSSYYSTYEEGKINRYVQVCREQMPHIKFVSDSKIEFIRVDKDVVYVYLPCIVNTNDFLRKIQYVIGHYVLYKGYINTSEHSNDIVVKILFNQEPTKEVLELLQNQSILYEIKLAEIDQLYN